MNFRFATASRWPLDVSRSAEDGLSIALESLVAAMSHSGVPYRCWQHARLDGQRFGYTLVAEMRAHGMHFETA